MSFVAWNGPHILSFVNAHGFNLAWNNAETAALFEGADTLLRDGSGMTILLRALGRQPGLNMNGTDFIPRLLSRYCSSKVAVFGTREPYLSRAAFVVEKMGGSVILSADGFQSDERYLALLANQPADLVLLAMGMPRQERLSNFLRAKLSRPCLIVNGGAILDFFAGRFARAPKLLRATGTEWFFRLALEPRRLWRRYITGNILFLFRVFYLRSRLRHSDRVSSC